MTWASYGAYLGIAVLLVLAPGPDTLVLLRNALAGGRRGGLLACAGILAGNLLQGSAAAFGLGVLVASSRPLFETLRWAGVAYLLFLAVQALRGAWRGDYAAFTELVEKRRGQGFRRFREGFLSNVTNPKVLVMYLSVLPQFLVPGVTTTADALLLAYTVGVLGAVWLLALVFVVHRVRAWLGRRRVRRSIDAVTGAALVGFGVALAAE
ncbi:LysE family translocator [Pseudonocardia yuanmonensis]|uniref:LysE family translocator n=1 Tax=Pseudonocardia yuanmonensis TaxID=1095914 RepID=A0ABP8W6T0_9PSEU